MRLYFMKQSALDYLKTNIGTLYNNYYQFSTSEWIDDLFDYDPFELFMTVKDFELADLELQPGEIDFLNCKILYENLQDISDSQASDERLWAGLCNKTFYSYMRGRWQYARRHLKKTAEDSSAILSRYFYRNTGRSGLFRNTLARCWWTGRLTYSDKYQNHWELLDAIGSEDLISKISDIFYSNTYSSNPDIVEGFCKGLKLFRDHGKYVSNRDHIRPTAQYLNAIGGGLLLDMFSVEEIESLVIERLSLLMNGVVSEFFELERFDNDDMNDIDQLPEDVDAEEVNLDFIDYLDSLSSTSEKDLTKALGDLQQVEYGCTITLRRSPDNDLFVSKMPLAGEALNLLQSRLLGKKLGFSCLIGGKNYEVVDIRR